MADLPQLSRTLRLLLESASEAPPLTTLLTLVDAFVLEVSGSPNSGELLTALEDELQEIYEDVTLWQAEVFLALLYHLRPVLPPSSLIATWFDLLLRPALREPQLPIPALNHAKELIIAGLDSGAYTDNTVGGDSEEERERQREKIGEFRRRLMDLYLLDAYNESSGDDVLEWASLDTDQRDSKACWKANLEDVLVRAGLEKPQDFLTETYHCFSLPSSRLQLLILLDVYTSQPQFPDVAHVMAAHPLTTSLLYSLLFDGSSTAATIGLTIVTKLLPIYAVKACEDLKRLLPLLLAVLARIVCWRKRRRSPSPGPSSSGDGGSDADSAVEDEHGLDESAYTPPIREDLEWTRLEQTFESGPSTAPSAHRYFTGLYYLFPCNTLRFLRHPVQYMKDSGQDSPYDVGWEDALDEDQIRSKSEPLLRGHVLHPLLIWRTPVEELAKPDFWTQYDVARIVGDCTMLDMRNAALGVQQRTPAILSTDPEPVTVASPLARPAGRSEGPSPDPSEETSRVSSPTVRVEPSTPAGKPRISLQDMIATSIALRSGIDVEVVQPSSAWSAGLIPSQGPADGDVSPAVPDNASVRAALPSSQSAADDEPIPVQVGHALAGLQREVLLLRNELNFELWNARENVKHIGRLYQDRVLSKTAEMERQGLHNKLREYKNEVASLQRKLKEHKDSAISVKNQYFDWNRSMQDKLTEFRSEKKKWEAEAAAMRSADKEAKDRFAAQKKLLAEATRDVLMLQTRIKENAHKIDRLHDYENQIDQLVKLQRLWELDIQKLNDQAEYLQVFTSKYRKMELRLETYEKTHAEMEQVMEGYRQRIKTRETELAGAQKQLESARKVSRIAQLSSSGNEIKKLKEANERLRDENAVLRDEVEEVKAMVEVLKARSERPGGRDGWTVPPGTGSQGETVFGMM